MGTLIMYMQIITKEHKRVNIEGELTGSWQKKMMLEVERSFQGEVEECGVRLS